MSSDDREHLLGGLEALLFASAQPLPVSEAARILGIPEAMVDEMLHELENEYRSSRRGVRLERVGNGVFITTKPEYAHWVNEIGRPIVQGGLSPAALETLAIIAYRQPVSRADIEAIRGVKSDSAIGSLLERGLIEEAGRAQTPGRPVLFATTEAFLVQFGLEGLTQLPPLPDPGPNSGGSG